MDVVARESGGFGTVLLPVDKPLLVTPVSPVLSETHDFYFKHGWDQRDARYRGLPRFKQSGFMVDLDYFSNEEIERNPYYQEFLGRFGLRWSAVLRIATPDGDCALSIQRTIKAGPFSASEQRVLARGGPKLSNAATLANYIGHARRAGAFELLEELGASAILLDARGEVVRINNRAEQLLCPEFGIHHKRITIAHREVSDEVAAAISLLLRAQDTRTLGPVAVPRPARRPLVLRFIRLNNGETLADAAEQLKIAGETARTRLKAIFAKTEIHKQGALVALLPRVGRAF
jgi:hypothetical protein